MFQVTSQQAEQLAQMQSTFRFRHRGQKVKYRTLPNGKPERFVMAEGSIICQLLPADTEGAAISDEPWLSEAGGSESSALDAVLHLAKTSGVRNPHMVAPLVDELVQAQARIAQLEQQLHNTKKPASKE